MQQVQFPLRARALVGLTVEPAVEEVTGFRKDGRPIIRRQRRDLRPGDTFLIEDERTYRLLLLGDAAYAELIDEHDHAIPIGDDGVPARRIKEDVAEEHREDTRDG